MEREVSRGGKHFTNSSQIGFSESRIPAHGGHNIGLGGSSSGEYA